MPAERVPSVSPTIQLGLKENLGQFSLLVLVNAFVGGMVGLERTVVPLIGSQEFGLVLRTAIFSFIVTFGLVKAFSNLFAGGLADRFGRKKVLVAGWLVGVPVPLILMYAPSWEWIVAANVLLGVNQGLAWSMTVIMKIDLVGPRRRGLAIGLNEFAGYLAVGLTALATGYLASLYGLRPEPFYLGVTYALLGLVISCFLVRDTREHVRLEMEEHPPEPNPLTLREVFAKTSYGERRLLRGLQGDKQAAEQEAKGAPPLPLLRQRPQRSLPRWSHKGAAAQGRLGLGDLRPRR